MAYDIGPRIGIEGEKEFREAISQINTNMKTLGTEMLRVASQFDKNDKSTEALTSKNEVLNKQIDLQKQKLAELQKGLAAAADKYGENDKVTQGWQQAVNKATADLNNMERELNDNIKSMDKLGDETEKAGGKFESFKSIVKGVVASVGVVTAAAGAAAIKMGKDVLQQFGELEQNLGGSEAVFGKYADSIQKAGEDAYKNLGVSQSEYLATANKMGALFQGSGVEQQKSLELTEKAMQRAADMASVMGIDMQVALDSVAGAAKGNFTMMDNLGVAMNATTIEAYALAKGLDFTWKMASNAEKAEIAMQMFFEKTEQYAGNFARESTQTITGSIGLLQAAVKSFVAGLGNENADMSNLTKNVTDAFQAVVNNVVPIIGNLTTALPVALGAMLPAIGELLPSLLETLSGLFSQVLQSILSMLPSLIPAGVQAMMTIVDAVIGNLPLILDVAIQIILALIDGLTQALPELVPVAVDAVLKLVETLVNNIDILIDAGIQLVLALAKGIINALPQFIEMAPKLINEFWAAFDKNLLKILEAGLQLIVMLGMGIIQNIPLIIANAGEIVKAIFTTISHLNLLDVGKNIITSLGQGLSGMSGNIMSIIRELITKVISNFKSINWADVGLNIINGIRSGIISAAGNLVQAGIDAAKEALDGIKKFLGIKSPSTVMRDQVGKMIGVGMAEGITASARQVDAAMAGLNSSISSKGIKHTPVSTSTESYDTTGEADGLTEVTVNTPVTLDGKVIATSTSKVQLVNNYRKIRRGGVVLA